MIQETKKIIQLYERRGFKIMDIHADNEFERIWDEMRPIEMEAVPADEHIGEAERSIRTTKERTRCTIHGLPYKQYTKLMIIDLVNTCTQSLNQTPALNRISNRISPLTLVTGKGNINYNNLKLAFRSYVLVFEDNTRTNTTIMLNKTCLFYDNSLLLCSNSVLFLIDHTQLSLYMGY
jgi:hypothetical protein